MQTQCVRITKPEKAKSACGQAGVSAYTYAGSSPPFKHVTALGRE